ncbi:MAG: hypothetical protein IKX00_02105 [Bacilli bacterium]|nr:hypothetical protein [Bacilli bacterium]
MKKILLVLIILLLCGCYNYTEINNLVLVNGIFVDYQDGLYKLKFDADETVESTGLNLSDAFRNFEETISKKPFYAHTKVLIISKEIFINHLNGIIEYFLRNNDFRNNFYLIVSDDINDVKSDYIKDIITNNNDVITSPLFKKILTNYLDNKEIILPVMTDNYITGSIIKDKDNVKEFNINDTRLYKIYKNTKPNIIYQNINIYHSKVKKYKDTLYISLDAELREKKDININKLLKDDLERLLNKKVILNIDINRNGQLLNEKE